jgi:hypothetical protein
MKRLWIAGVGLLLGLLSWASPAQALDCAFEDTNDNQVFDGADVIVPDAAWLGGAAFVTANGFVVPVGCDHTLIGGVPAVAQGVRVTAAKITFNGTLDYLAPGGRGVVLIATGDFNMGDGLAPARIVAGGFNALPATEIAVARKSIALVGGGLCRFQNAEVRGTVPLGSTGVGIRCTGDLSFRGSQVIGSKVNIQSLLGLIDAGNGAVSAGGLLSLAGLCDSPATNLTGNGDGSGTITPGDFPCSLNLGGVVNFADANALAQACTPFALTPGNRFIALNDPLVMIAGAGAALNVLDVRFASIVGRFRVTLAAEDGALLTQGATIDNGEQLGITPPGGAKVWLFADPTTVVRLPVDHEDFLGPSAAQTFIQDACYRSPNDIQVGKDAANVLNLVGTPAPPPCAQLNEFVGVLNGIF